jgi:CheY-like chemotaxis protein
MPAAPEQRTRFDILLVEDNPPDVFLLQSTCPDVFQHHAVHVINNGEDALEFVDQRGRYVTAPRPHLIILDLNIPRVDGLDVLRRIKTDSRVRAIPVLVFTTARAGEIIANAYAAGANAVLAKPENLEGYDEVCNALEQFWLKLVLPYSNARAADGDR